MLNCGSVKVDYLDYEILSFCSHPFRSNLKKRYPFVCDRHFSLFELRVRKLKLNKIFIGIKFYHNGLCTSVRPVYILCTKQEHQGKVIIR